MNPENKNGSEEMKELIERLRAKEAESSSVVNGGRVEFDFSPKLPETKLVFLDDDGSEPEEEPKQQISPAKTEAPAEEQKPQRADDEFEIPENFVLTEDLNQPLPEEETPMIWKTYVPRFTEVTERQYKLKDDTKAADVPTQNAQEGSSASVIRAEQIDPVTGIRTDLKDSTSEHVEKADTDAVVVNINGKVKDSSDSINVFKFPKNEATERIVPSEEELEKASIRALFGKDEQPAEEPLYDAVTEDEAIDAEPEVPEAPKVYDIPDIDSETAVFSNETTEESDLLPEEEPEGAFATVSARDMKSTKEFNSGVMREHFKDRFLDTIISHKLRIAVAILLSLVALAFENLALFGVDVCKSLGIGGSLIAPVLLDALIVVALLVLAIPEIIKSVRALKEKTVIPELSVSAVALAIFAYTAVILSYPTSSYPLFGFAYSIIIISAVWSSLCKESARFSVFKLIADNDKKIVLDNRLTRSLEKENMALDGAVDEYDSRIARSFETTFVSDFYERSERSAEDGKNNLLVLILTFGIAMVTAAVMFFIGDGAVSAFSSFTLVVALGLPAFAILSHKLPYHHLQSKCVKSDCAVIGEKTYSEYAGVDVIAFEDSEVFGEEDVVLKSISLSDKDGDFRKVMRRMTSLFASLGGPLHRMFRNSIGKSFEPATDMTVEADGASGRTDGVMIMAGTAEYMERHGVRIPYESPSIQSTKTMYAAEDGVLFAKFSIQYSFSEEFAMLLPSFKERGIVPLIYTRDPNLTNELMRFLTGGADVIRIMRRYNKIPESPKVYRRLSSGIVTLSDKSGAINLVLLSKKYEKLQYGTALTELAASAVGCALAAAISVTDMILSVPSVLLGVWQLAWCFVLGVISARTFGGSQKKQRKDK